MAEPIVIRVKDEAVLKALDELADRTRDMTPVMRSVAGALADGIEQAFEEERDPTTGKSWPKLSKVTIRRRKAAGHWPGKKLQVSGHLASSIVPRYGRDFAAAGTNVKYAGTLQRGARRGQYGRGKYKTRRGSFPIPWGKIPPRPFIGLSSATREDILDIVGRHLIR